MIPRSRLLGPARARRRQLRIEEAQAASGPAGGVSREAAARTGVAVILKERAASCSASPWNALQRNPYCWRSVGGSRPAVDSRCAGTNTRKGAGRRASRITAATSFAGAVTAIVSPLICAAKYSRKSASERGITEAGVPNRRGGPDRKPRGRARGSGRAGQQVPICGMLAAEHVKAFGSATSWCAVVGLSSERKGGMTGKADFTEDEWRIVLEGPPTAGMIVVTAQRGGTFRETLAIAKAYVEARKHHGESELLDEIVSAKPELDHTRYHSAEELKEHGLQHLRDAVELLERKAT